MKHPGDWRAYLVDVLEHGTRREKVATWVWMVTTLVLWVGCFMVAPSLGSPAVALFFATPVVTCAALRWFLRRRKALPFSERVDLCVNQLHASGAKPTPAQIEAAVQAWRRKNDVGDRKRLAKAVYKRLNVKDPYRPRIT